VLGGKMSKRKRIFRLLAKLLHGFLEEEFGNTCETKMKKRIKLILMNGLSLDIGRPISKTSEKEDIGDMGFPVETPLSSPFTKDDLSVGQPNLSNFMSFPHPISPLTA
jgi:hypothetical protein